MHKTKTLFTGWIVAAVAVLTVLGATPAQASTSYQSKDKPAGAPAAAAVDDSLAPDRVATVAASPAATAALAAIQERIASYVATHGTGYSFGSYLDATTGQIVVDTDAPADVTASLTRLPATTTPQLLATSQVRVQVRSSTIADAYDRRDDIPPFYGGGGLYSGGFLCSSGYAVQNSAGTRFMSTAGHCYGNGDTVLTESRARTYGTVSSRRLPPVTGHAMDVELIGGQSYSPRIFTGGVTSSSSIPVVAAGTAYVGYTNYCHSGRTTGEQCGHTATSITGQVCTTTGCKSPVIVFTGGTLSAGGDSGGPFYAKDSSGAWIRGHVIAGNSVDTSYAQPWTVISAALGVSIVTG